MRTWIVPLIAALGITLLLGRGGGSIPRGAPGRSAGSEVQLDHLRIRPPSGFERQPSGDGSLFYARQDEELTVFVTTFTPDEEMPALDASILDQFPDVELETTTVAGRSGRRYATPHSLGVEADEELHTVFDVDRSRYHIRTWKLSRDAHEAIIATVSLR